MVAARAAVTPLRLLRLLPTLLATCLLRPRLPISRLRSRASAAWSAPRARPTISRSPRSARTQPQAGHVATRSSNVTTRGLVKLTFGHFPPGVGRDDRQRASLGISQQSCCCFQEHANRRENDFNEADDRMSLHCRISHDAVFRGYSGECAGSAQRLLSAKLPECGGLWRQVVGRLPANRWKVTPSPGEDPLD